MLATGKSRVFAPACSKNVQKYLLHLRGRDRGGANQTNPNCPAGCYTRSARVIQSPLPPKQRRPRLGGLVVQHPARSQERAAVIARLLLSSMGGSWQGDARASAGFGVAPGPPTLPCARSPHQFASVGRFRNTPGIASMTSSDQTPASRACTNDYPTAQRVAKEAAQLNQQHIAQFSSLATLAKKLQSSIPCGEQHSEQARAATALVDWAEHYRHLAEVHDLAFSLVATNNVHLLDVGKSADVLRRIETTSTCSSGKH